ncbi:neurogenic locus notch homolog protein 1-like [Lolium rigidum]|uniref:neurogenic locus notch homolog protein 1-like n=1 Tax=Lolium rigidum TaxID=89674 RepID=UPI001F5DA47E|nr:neurogenic locus notch homolog protein 1-like [Lolium rigidum]
MRRFAGGAAALVLILSVTTARVAVADFFSPLSPLLAPVMGSLCKAVACGKGNCTVTSGLPGYRCDCDPGWTQMHVGDDLRFLPCVIPNCTIDRSCSNDTSAPSPAPLPKNFSLSADPCELAYCGSGGTCKNGTGLSYHCECKEGFSNVLNMTTMPCFHECSYGANCAALGILPSSNSTSAAPPAGSASVSNNCNAPAPGLVSRQILLPLLILALVAMMDQAT